MRKAYILCQPECLLKTELAFLMKSSKSKENYRMHFIFISSWTHWSSMMLLKLPVLFWKEWIVHSLILAIPLTYSTGHLYNWMVLMSVMLMKQMCLLVRRQSNFVISKEKVRLHQINWTIYNLKLKKMDALIKIYLELLRGCRFIWWEEEICIFMMRIWNK